MNSLLIPTLDHLVTVENFILPPLDSTEVRTYRHDFELALQQARLGRMLNHPIVEAILDSWECHHAERLKAEGAIVPSLAPSEFAYRDAAIAALIARQSVEQRTAAWYAQAARVLTASEFATILRPTRQRALLAHSKAFPPTPEEAAARFRSPLSCPSQYMSPFDWGIRFEPVVKQIYEHIHGVQITDLGRLMHQTDTRLAASPDGLISTGTDCSNPLIGRLIEIKCPISRDIGGEIPEEYYAQMQLQLEVTGQDTCQYVETRFRSPAGPKTLVHEGPGRLAGVLWHVERIDPVTNEAKRRYEYGPVGFPDLAEPPCHLIGQYDKVLERVPWELLGWHEVEVRRSATWWFSASKAVDAFWADVAGSLAGTFVVPASKRPPRAPKEEALLIAMPPLTAVASEQVDTDEPMTISDECAIKFS
jgi:hypothetical protein